MIVELSRPAAPCLNVSKEDATGRGLPRASQLRLLKGLRDRLELRVQSSKMLVSTRCRRRPLTWHAGRQGSCQAALFALLYGEDRSGGAMFQTFRVTFPLSAPLRVVPRSRFQPSRSSAWSKLPASLHDVLDFTFLSEPAHKAADISQSGRLEDLRPVVR